MADERATVFLTKRRLLTILLVMRSSLLIGARVIAMRGLCGLIRNARHELNVAQRNFAERLTDMLCLKTAVIRPERSAFQAASLGMTVSRKPCALRRRPTSPRPRRACPGRLWRTCRR